MLSFSVLLADTYFGVPDPWFHIAAAVAGICTAGLVYIRRSWRLGLLGTVLLSQLQHHSSPPAPGSVGVCFAIASYVVLMAAGALSARANGRSATS